MKTVQTAQTAQTDHAATTTTYWKTLSYDERLRAYERDKAWLYQLNLTPDEYQRRIREIADKWGI